MAGLCVSLTPETLDDVFTADISRADCVEVRLDYLKNPQESTTARWDRLPLPVIATCRGKDRGGLFTGSIEEETRILDDAAKNGARFIDIDYRFVKKFGNAEVIASYHDFTETPVDLDSIIGRACATSADIAKVATYVNSWADNRRLLDLLARDRQKPIIVIGMGEIGQITRVVGMSRGSFLTYAATDRAAAPGQLDLREMLDVYRVHRIRRDTKLLGVLGNPVRHSLSPVLHNRAFNALDLNFAYLKLPATDLRDFFDSTSAIGIEGFSVTIPHKTAVIDFLNAESLEALEAGAVNTLYRRNGKWFGENTDVQGVRAALASASFNPIGKTIVIMGAGGAAKAAQAALRRAKSVTVLTRRQLAEASDISCDLLINATPIGMWPNVDESPIEGPISANAVFDMVYNPPVTRFLRSAADQGKTVIQGTAMFLAQAARQFEIWTGHPAPAEIFEAHLDQI